MTEHKNGIREFKFGGITIWDMRKAQRGYYHRNNLKHHDLVIFSERKASRIGNNGEYLKLSKKELKSYITIVEIKINELIKSETHIKDK